ncbi:hypothetical protein P4U07_22345 [Bacillus mycoides]|uniref:hypothetical protein n=1 Tax=Bacillus mycoides TaxID=1405 RepID=UPI002E1FE6BA|nr:hypothetical protein [Bacillus mycoides]
MGRGIFLNYNKKIKELLDCVDQADDNEIEWKSMSIEFFNSSEIEEGQVGYHVDLDGQNLTSDKEGDWREEWIVIGMDSYVGDPVFVDINDINLPVYTAEHGEDFWNPVRKGDSIDEVIQQFKQNKA